MTEVIVSWTEDSLFAGELVCRQHRTGYRFSIDAILAAHFCHPEQGCRLLDLGTGSGIISLILRYRFAAEIVQITALEIQPQLAELAATNFRLNGFSNCVGLLGDVRQISRLLPAESFDQVVCNPPFFLPGCGRMTLDEESCQARHQLTADLNDFITAAAYAVKNGGQVVLIYPAEQLAELIVQLKAARLAPKELQFIYNYPGADRDCAQRVLVRCRKNGRQGVKILTPFYVYTDKNGPLSEAMSSLYKAKGEID